jgi:hypothetical protein
LRNKQLRQEKLAKLERAMRYKYKSHAINEPCVSVIKHANYPNHFKDASDAVLKIENYEKRNWERSMSKERNGKRLLNRYNSNECFVSPSLKQQLSKTQLNKPGRSSEGRHRSNSSQKRYRLSDYNHEVGKLFLS